MNKKAQVSLLDGDVAIAWSRSGQRELEQSGCGAFMVKEISHRKLSGAVLENVK